MTFVILDTTARRPHVPATWPTADAAERELAALLRPYPAGSEWRARLTVVAVADMTERQQRGLAPSVEPASRVLVRQTSETPAHRERRRAAAGARAEAQRERYRRARVASA